MFKYLLLFGLLILKLDCVHKTYVDEVLRWEENLLAEKEKSNNNIEDLDLFFFILVIFFKKKHNIKFCDLNLS